ncbi:MAG: TIGR02646 family protein [Alcaligenaceae bacterium]|nr:TIGR02646 family protein [Alcaligenaceae bacterium]
MKKINKSSSPADLTAFSTANEQASWDDFRQHNIGTAYLNTKNSLFADQGGLCAYCEKNVGNLSSHLQRIEHFHPKSDRSNPAKNWGLDWHNMLAVCTGGSNKTEADHTIHPLPENLSCDAYKDHCITAKKLHVNCEGDLLNPIELNSTLCLFDFDKATGKLLPNYNVCLTVNFSGTNNFTDLSELLTKTIELLNLNCQRLCEDRLTILKQYNQEIAKARRINDKLIFQKLAEKWFSKKWPSFFTTRRILLGTHAEKFLTENQYNG